MDILITIGSVHYFLFHIVLSLTCRLLMDSYYSRLQEYGPKLQAAGYMIMLSKRKLHINYINKRKNYALCERFLFRNLDF